MDASQLCDFHEIQMLKARYFRCMDLRLWAEFRDVFTDDLELYLEASAVPDPLTRPAISGADALVAYLAAADPGKRTVHQGHMPEITFTDHDHATGIWAMFDWVDDPGRGTIAQGYGHYHEQYLRCADGRWRIRSVRLTRLRNNLVSPSGEEIKTTLIESTVAAVSNLAR